MDGPDLSTATIESWDQSRRSRDSACMHNTPIGLKIASFLASFALVIAGAIYGVTAATAFLAGDVVGAIGQGADHAAAKAAVDTDPDIASTSSGLHDVGTSAKSFALRAKLVAGGIALIAAALLLGGELVRRRYAHRAVPIVLGVAVAGQLAFAIASKSFGLLALGAGACAFGAFVWTRCVRDAQAQRDAGLALAA